MKWTAAIRVAAGVALLVGALVAGAPSRAQPVPEQAMENESEAGASKGRAIYDPWEPMNRGIFAFNDRLDQWVLEPVAKGWDFVFDKASKSAYQD